MKRSIAILGTILITVVILISGSAVAPWHHAVGIYHYENVSDRFNILGAPNGTYASLGFDGPPPELGVIVLDLGSGNEMGPSQDFTVFADTAVEEDYSAAVAESPEDDGVWVGDGEDTQDFNFTTPSTPGMEWRYIILIGTSGVTAFSGGDYYYGPDIDAVGWI